MVINYLPLRRARRCASIMAQLGVRTLAELIGRTELLRARRRADAEAAPARSVAAALDSGPCGGRAAVLQRCRATRRSTRASWPSACSTRHARRHRRQERRRVRLRRAATSTARIGARLSGEIARRCTATTAWAMRRSTCGFTGIGRPELRRLERRRPAPVPGRRCQRLRRQGHGRRARSCSSRRASARYRRAATR